MGEPLQSSVSETLNSRAFATSRNFVTRFKAETERQSIVIDLTDVKLVDRGAVKFLEGCEAGGMKLENCPAYIREWILTERR